MVFKLGQLISIAKERCLAILATVLICLGVWIVLPEMLLGGSANLSANQAAHLADLGLGEARIIAAARIGIIRGDLWTNVVEVYESKIAHLGPASGGLRQRLSNACLNALSLTPISPRVWALCAPYCHDYPPSNCTTRYIQMSYLTGPYMLEAIPSRLRMAMKIDLNAAPDLKMLVAADIRFILRQEPEMKPELLLSYHDALPLNKPIILADINEIDPHLAAALQ